MDALITRLRKVVNSYLNDKSSASIFPILCTKAEYELAWNLRRRKLSYNINDYPELSIGKTRCLMMRMRGQQTDLVALLVEEKCHAMSCDNKRKEKTMFCWKHREVSNFNLKMHHFN